MSVRSFFSKWFGSKHPTMRKPMASIRLGLEYLEDRWVPATVTVSGVAGLQTALMNAAGSTGETIDVASGTYALNLQIPASTGLHLVAPSGATIESPSNTSSSAVVEFLPGANSAGIKGFVINGDGDANATAGILVDSGARPPSVRTP